ncbi:MAG: prolyl oligopeptidase family serine peptidase [Gemmataceae bacterium]
MARSFLLLLFLTAPTSAQGPKGPTVDEGIRAEAKNAPLALRFTGATAKECLIWQKTFAAKLRDLLGPHAPPKTCNVEIERTADEDGYRFEELLLTADGHPPLPVCVLIPGGVFKGKRPGILALHGHGPNGHYAIAKGDAGKRLVKAGFVVVAPCMTPFGRRLGDPKAYGKQDPCAVTFVRLQLLGKVLMAENLRDCLWAFEYLSRHDRVDNDKLGCVGLSYGGRMTMLTSALEPRIKIAVISGALNVMQERVAVRYSCGAQVIPGLLNYGDVPEIASLIAPRPAVWEAGSKDSLIEPKWAEEVLTRMRRAYKAFGAEDRLVLDRFEGGHEWSWRAALPLLEKTLK